MDGHWLIHTNGTLLLRAVKAEDSGYYTCTATNTGGFDTIIVNLLVQGETLRGGRGSGADRDGGIPSREREGCRKEEEDPPLGRQTLGGSEGPRGSGGRRAREGNEEV